MPNAANAQMLFEAGTTQVAAEELSDSGDQLTFTSVGVLWSESNVINFAIRPNGILTGGAVTAASSLANNAVDVALSSANLNGAEANVVASPALAVTRGTVGDPFRTSSIVINAAGVYAVVAGTEGAAVVETRGAAGGPPFIPVDAIEVGQVRLTANTAAPVTASEIRQIPLSHREEAGQSVWTEDFVKGQITFVTVQPSIHTASVPRKVFADYGVPQFAELTPVLDYVQSDTSYSLNSTPFYGGVAGTSTASLNAGSFTYLAKDNITDPIIKARGDNRWFQYFQDRNKLAHNLDKGIVGISRTNPAGADLSLAVTINAAREAINNAS